jgi:hypothetical protein
VATLDRDPLIVWGGLREPRGQSGLCYSDTSRARLQSTLTAAEGNLYAVALGPAGTHVSAGGTAQSVVTWQIDPDTVAASTCPRTGTPMTQDEWQQVAPGVPYDPPCPLPAVS